MFHEVARAHLQIQGQERLSGTQRHGQLHRWPFAAAVVEVFRYLRHPQSGIEKQEGASLVEEPVLTNNYRETAQVENYVEHGQSASHESFVE